MLWAGPAGPADGNNAPSLEVTGGSVRPDRTVTLEATASDPDADPGDAAKQEAVQLDAAFKTGSTAPSWLTTTTWTDGPEEFPELEIEIAAPEDAQPGSYTLLVSATDGRGLTTQKDLAWQVLAPLCGGALEYDLDGACATCAANHVPNVSKTACTPCGADTQRQGTATACTACPEGLASEPGGDCRCGTSERLQNGSCTACPDHADSADDPLNCAPCAANHERPSGAAACRACPAGRTSDGGSGCLPTLTLALSAATVEEGAGATAVRVTASVAAAPGADLAVALTLGGTATETADYTATGARSLTIAADATSGTTTLTVTALADATADAGETIEIGATASGRHAPKAVLTVAEPASPPTLRASVDSPTLSEGAGKTKVTLTLADPPASGRYTGCGLRLASGGAAGELDVEFTNGDRVLEAANGWTASGKLLKIRDDALAEGDETLAVEGRCTGSDAGTDPAAADLAAETLTLTITDNEALTAALSVDTPSIDETDAATAVRVTATLGFAVERSLSVPLTFGGTAAENTDYTLTGTRSVTVAGGGSQGSTTLTVTPAADADSDDETIVIGASPAGYAVTSATLTLREPPPPPAIVLSTASSTLAEDAGDVRMRMTLANPPASGKYTGCRVRLAAGSAAGAADVEFMNQKKLRADGATPWSAEAKFLKIVDDDLEEGAETLLVEGYCTASAGADPAHDALSSTPLALTIEDNDRYVTLSLSPDEVGETGGEQSVTVAGSVATAPDADVSVSLDLGAGDYTVTGTRSLTIAAAATSGSTTLAVTPTGDTDTTDDEVTVGGAAGGYAVRSATLTIAEPTTVGGVDLSGLGVRLGVAPTAIREGTSGTHTVTATLTGVPTPAVDVAMVLSVGGTAVQGASHDYTLTGPSAWPRLTVSSGDAHATASADVAVNALSDQTREGGETVTFSISQVTWGTTPVTVDPPATAVLAITEAWDTPAAPTDVSVSRTAGNETRGLTVAWSAVSATPAVDSYTVQHRERGAAGWTQTTATSTSAQVSGLKAGTEYEVQVAARNAKELGPFSAGVFAFTAPGDCVVGAPSATSPSGDAAITQLSLSWAAPACGSTIASYRIRYREDPGEAGTGTSWSEQDSTGTAATLRSLAADTTYVVQVMAVAANGDRGPWSAEGRGKTSVDTRLPPRLSAPSVVPNASMGGSRLDATWTRTTWVDGQGVSRPIASYQYRYRKEAGAETDWTAPVDATARAAETTTLTRTVEGLDGSTWYLVQVRGVNRLDGAAHPGRWSEPGRGRTWGRPDRVGKPTAYRGDSAVDVLWTAPDDGGSAITNYLVEYKLSAGGWLTHAYAGCADGTCATETAVNAAAAQVRVAAANATGTGAWSKAADVRSLKLLRVSYGAADADLDEGRSLLVTVNLNQTADRSVTVPLTTEPASGSFRLDGAANSRVVFAYGTTSQTFSLVAAQDDDADDETVTLGFGTLPDAVMRAAPASLTVDIADDEGAAAPAQCAAATVSHCELQDAASGATAAGACGPGYAGACSYSCADGTWTLAANTCAAERCGSAQCADGACDARADDDTGSCDVGSYADATDTGEEWKWTCGGTACSAAKPAAPACGAAEGSCTRGTASAAADTLDPATERWSCSNGGETAACSAAADACGAKETHALDGQGELECRCEAGHHRHDGACTADPACNASPTGTADACTAGTYGATPADTYLDGACGTAANSCDAGTADESPADAAAVDGACGTAVDGCAAGALEAVDDTDAEHRWNCLGDDGAANWSCAGTAGAWNWSCTAGAQTLGSCTAPKTGSTATGCTSAVAAGDAACSLCKTGHERCGGSCVAQCGANEVRNAETCACDCDTGHHRHNGACVEDPACNTGATGSGDACAPGTYADAPADSYENGACATAPNSCDAGDADESPADWPAMDGACGTAAGECTAGTPQEVDDTESEQLWNCLAKAGEINWNCTGTSGNWNWSCTSGAVTLDSCAAAKTGTTATCTSTVSGDDASCSLCRTGYENCGGTCLAQCGANEVRANDCSCECRSGFASVNGVCTPCNAGASSDSDACTVGDYDADPADTYMDGACGTGANSCRHNVDADESPADVAPEHGSCGSRNKCASGNPGSIASITGGSRWVCSGVDGTTNWNCAGTTGRWNWTCVEVSTVIGACAKDRTGATKACSSPVDARDVTCIDCDAGYHEHNETCVPDPVCGAVEPNCTVPDGPGTDLPDTPAVNGSCNDTEAEQCSSGDFSDLRDTTLVNGVCGTTTSVCTGGVRSNERENARQNLWDCLGTDEAKRWHCAGKDGVRNWQCTSGGRTAQCTATGAAARDKSCREVVTEATHARSCFTCKPCGGDNEVPDPASCECVCETGYYPNSNGVCVLPCNAGASSDSDACTVGEYDADPADTYLDGACGKGANVCRHNVDADRSPADVAPEYGVCGTAAGDCPGGNAGPVTPIPGGSSWTCSGVDGATNWNCAGTTGKWNWTCLEGTTVIGACMKDRTGATKACTSPVDATDATCIACDAGFHEHGEKCVADPVCKGIEDCDPSAATHGAVADTISPAEHKWQCTHGGMTKACTVAAPGCGSNAHYELDGDENLQCVCDAGFAACTNGSCRRCTGQNEVLDLAACSCVCASGYYPDANDVCVLPCNASASSEADACAVGDHDADPADTYVDGACLSAANGCQHNVDADTSPRDVDPEHGACGTAAGDCRGGNDGPVTPIPGGSSWTCSGVDGATNWNCAGTTGKWNWTCLDGTTVIGACMKDRTGATKACTSPVDATDVTCIACDAGFHEHGEKCVADPVCKGIEDCDPSEATHGAVADTISPAEHKWQCTHGGMTRACTVAAPGCGSNAHYELDGGDNLQCVCDAGFTACNNGSCHRCAGQNEVLDQAACSCVCASGYYRDSNDVCVAPCSSAPTNNANACNVGDYTDPPADTYENGACGTTANSCAGGDPDESPADDPPVAGACGSAANTCAPGTPTSKSMTDSEYLWTCEGTDGTAKWHCLGKTGKWNWTCTTPDAAAHACMAPWTGSDARDCPATIEADDPECRLCKPAYRRVNGVCEPKPALTATLAASPNPVEVDSSTTVTWSSNNATTGSVTCSGAGVDYTASSTSGSASLTPTAAGTIACSFTVTGQGTWPESAADDVNVVVKTPASCATLAAGTAPMATTGCASGTYSDRTDSNELYKWFCSSVTKLPCSNPKAAACKMDTTQQCLVGNPVNVADQLDPAVRKWKCINGPVANRSTANCSQPFTCGVGEIAKLGTDGELFCDDLPIGCEGETVNWSVGNYNCSAHVGPTTAGERAAHLESLTATDSTQAHTGSATFACDDGEWTGPTNATCTCDAQCVCAAAGGTWVEARPERERTCEGNSGCAGHTHSCTTPPDPDGGFQSCTYKKHKGGLNCASHSHRTCEPYPATAAHCHLEIDPEQCPTCRPF